MMCWEIQKIRKFEKNSKNSRIPPTHHPRFKSVSPLCNQTNFIFRLPRLLGSIMGKKESGAGCLSLPAYVSGPSWKSFEQLAAEPRFSGATVSTHREYSPMVLNLKV
jgi:hypothetical protein